MSRNLLVHRSGVAFAAENRLYQGGSMGGEEEKKQQQQAYLEGLKRYHDRGIPIYIDGRPCPEDEWHKIFEVREDGGFYMGDYVGADEGRLREIRFDRVYLYLDDKAAN